MAHSLDDKDRVAMTLATLAGLAAAQRRPGRAVRRGLGGADQPLETIECRCHVDVLVGSHASNDGGCPPIHFYGPHAPSLMPESARAPSPADGGQDRFVHPGGPLRDEADPFVSMISAHVVSGRRNLAAAMIHVMRQVGIDAFQTVLCPT